MIVCQDALGEVEEIVKKRRRCFATVCVKDSLHKGGSYSKQAEQKNAAGGFDDATRGEKAEYCLRLN